MKNKSKLMVITLLSVFLFSSNIQSQEEIYYLSISHEVADFSKWKIVFDQYEEHRKAAGIVDIFVKKDVNNINSITIFAEITNLEKAKAFTYGTELKEAMKNAGVMSIPSIVFYQSTEKYSNINCQALITTIGHSIANYKEWKEVYEAGDKIRKQEGVVDHLLLKNISDENFITVLGSSSSAADFIKFMKNDDLKSAMKKAGVTSKPSIKVLF